MERSRSLLAVPLATVLSVAACAGSDAFGTPLPGEEGTGSQSQSDAGCTPGQAPAPVSPSTLPSCCAAGKARCQTASLVAPYLAPRLSKCATGVCVPDVLLENPAHVPSKCASLNGAEGVCMSVCLPEVEAYASVLPRDSCAEDERCAPCVSPIDKKPTGACDLGKVCVGGASGDAAAPAPKCPHEGPPLIDATTLPACGTVPGAHCLGKDLVAEALRSQLAPCTGGYCVPDKMIGGAGNFVPKTCRSLAGSEGRCLHLALPAVAREKDRLPFADCDPEERCVPCFDPTTLADTGKK